MIVEHRVTLESIFRQELTNIMLACMKERYLWKKGKLPNVGGWVVWKFNQDRLYQTYMTFVAVIAETNNHTNPNLVLKSCASLARRWFEEWKKETGNA